MYVDLACSEKSCFIKIEENTIKPLICELIGEIVSNQIYATFLASLLFINSILILGDIYHSQYVYYDVLKLTRPFSKSILRI